MASLTLVPLTLELSTANPHSSSQTWNTIATTTTQGLISGSITRGRQFELDRVETGTASFVVLNTARNLDPDNSSGAYYPNLVPLRRVRLSAVYNSTTYYLYTGFIESITQNAAPGNKVATATITCVDGFEFLNLYTLSPARASYSAGSSGWGLIYTAKGISGGQNMGGLLGGAGRGRIPHSSVAKVGLTGPEISVSYVNQLPDSPLVVDWSEVTGQLKVYLASGPSGTLKNLSTAAQVMSAVGSSQAADYVDVRANGQTNTVIPTNHGVSGEPLAGGGYPAERSDLRVTRVLDALGWLTADRTLGVGVQTIQGVQFEKKDGVKALAHLQDVAAAEVGVFFQGPTGKMVFQNRTYRTTSPGNTEQATFSDAPTGGEFPYTNIAASFDLQRLYNNISITKQGSDTTQTKSNSTSITAYGQRDYTASLLVSSDSNASTIASALLARYKDPHTRFDSVTVQPYGLSNGLWAHALGREISDVIRVKRTPPGGGSAINVTCYIEAVSHSFDPNGWSTTWQLSPV